MTEPVDWRDDGLPCSPRFNDIYHSEAGALAQARGVFLAGCHLPKAWAGRPSWCVLETGFGLGLSFLATWAAWRGDPMRSGLLHYVAIEAHPAAAADLLRAARSQPELTTLAQQLAARWQGLLPGLHRLSFDEGRVLLTLAIGPVQPMLRGMRHFKADSLYLDGFSPDRNPDMWSPDTLRAVSRFARPGTRLATWTIARPVRDALAACGFVLRKAPGLLPKRDRLEGEFAPTWTVRRRASVNPSEARPPGQVAVIGAGLAGAAVAASLARRGWQVVVLDAAPGPATGASGLPAGVMAPHVSSDDALLSRLTRAGIRITFDSLQAMSGEGRDWSAGGVLERRPDGDLRLPAGWRDDDFAQTVRADADRLRAAGLLPAIPALWHARAGWARPASLVQTWLGNPGIRTRFDCQVGALRRDPQTAAPAWQVIDIHGHCVLRADRIVIAGGHRSIDLLPGWPLQSVRGQLAFGFTPPGAELPRHPINGDGHLVTGVPSTDASGQTIWLAGATFDRLRADARIDPADLQDNRERLARLHPAAAQALAPEFDQGRVQAWAGVRCASADRRPLVGPTDPGDADAPWLCSAMGSRGLSFAALCAELLAARWHAEPLPLPESLAKTLDTRRLWRHTQNAAWPSATTSNTPPSTTTASR